ncbi:MAG: response regulator [Deltaproteobacteria bacterium]|nr:response regulator [Deltaproteobacteria bacterium]
MTKRKNGVEKLKVLFVDDNETLAFIVQMVLEAAGHEVRTAGDGREGYFAYLRFKPDLVISDLEMPHENGPQMVRNIRRHDPYVSTVYVSGDAGRFDKVLEEEKRQYGASFLRKPFSRAELMQLVGAARRKALH